MSESAVVSPEVVRQRLGRYAIGASRDVRAVAELSAGEGLRAVVVSIWRRRGWVAVATDVGLRLARRPRLLGRGRDCSFDWCDLTAVRAGPQRVSMGFGAAEVDLVAVAPHDEFVRLIETARDHEAGPRKPLVGDVRDMARRKLGRFMAFGFEAAIDGLPDRLEPGERVERLAGATVGFPGLLVLTDRRLLLIDVTLRRRDERIWSVSRAGIRTVEPIDDGMRVLLREQDDVTVTAFLPPERRDEFAAVLYAGGAS